MVKQILKQLPKGIEQKKSGFKVLSVRTHLIDGQKKQIRKATTVKWCGLGKSYTQEDVERVWDKTLTEAIKTKARLDGEMSSYSKALSLKSNPNAIKFGTLKEAFDYTFETRWKGKAHERNVEIYKDDIFSFWPEDTLLKDMQTDEQYNGFCQFVEQRVKDRPANYLGSFSTSSVNRRLSALRCLFKVAIRKRWLTNADMLDPDTTCSNYGWANLAVGYTKEKTPLDEEQVQDVVDTAFADGEYDFADAFIVMVDTGVRHQEFAELTVDDVDYKDKSLRVRRTKTEKKANGQKVSYIPLTDRAYSVLVGRRADALARTDRRLFKISYARRRKLFDRYKDLCNLPEDFTPYATRHTFCTRLRECGVGKKALMDLAGHASLDTTERYYIKSSKNALKGAIGKLNESNTPLDKALSRKDPRIGHNSRHANVVELKKKVQ